MDSSQVTSVVTLTNPLYLNSILDLDITFYFEESINLAYAQWKFDKPL